MLIEGGINVFPSRVELMERGFTGELKDKGGVKCSVEDKLKAVLNFGTVVEGGRMVDMRGEC